MAAKKKEDSLTIEDKLKAALVPEVEQPYQIPEKWVWTYLLSGSAECLDQFRKPVNADERSLRQGSVPYYGATGQVGWIDDYLTDEQLVLLGEDGAPFLESYKAKAYMIEGKAWVNNHAHILRSFYGIFGNIFLLHYLNKFDYTGFVSGTTRLKLTQAAMRRMPVPLPPLPEQQRIAARLESLLGKIKEVKALLDEIPEILQDFRQSVLAAACSGRLTEDWREENPKVKTASDLIEQSYLNANRTTSRRAGRLWGAGVVPELTAEDKSFTPSTWFWTKVKTLGENSHDTVQVGPMSMQSRDFTDKGIPVLNVGCIQSGYIDEKKLNYLPQNIGSKFNRYRIFNNDILFTRSGTVGRCAIASESQDGYLMTFHLLRVRTTEKRCLPQYLLFVFQGAPHIRYQSDKAAIGSTRAGFNTNLLANLDIPLPPLPEQLEIVRRVESLFSKADDLEAQYKEAMELIESLPEIILSKAFRGQLVPQDSNDEPALALLERITDERERTKRKTLKLQWGSDE